jgi:hypothetical protein
MSIIVMGDVHGVWSKVNQLLNRHREIHMVLQAGDFGWWPKFHNLPVRTYTETWREWNQYGLKNDPLDVLILFCEGNHEDLEDLETRINPIMPYVYHMKRGTKHYLGDDDGRTILFMGGAESTDKAVRTPGKDWFPQESITQQDIYLLPDIKIDIVVSHTAPYYFDIIDPTLEDNSPSRAALNAVFDKYHPAKWYFGHFHTFKKGTYQGCEWTGLADVESQEQWWIEL